MKTVVISESGVIKLLTKINELEASYKRLPSMSVEIDTRPGFDSVVKISNGLGYLIRFEDGDIFIKD